ncbi:MAG: sulfatase-like hydrolase/transferase, partial [Saprospiraceae bacterium]
FKVQSQRNVILIIADDLGVDYCGCYERGLDTVPMPNIRKMLARGVRFNNAWSNPLCSPTRAGMLTGRYSFRTGVGNAVGGAGSAVLDTAEITIPKLLKQYKPGGIATANIGKWHLSNAMPISNLKIPNDIGYDHFEGGFTGILSSYTDWSKITNGVSTNITTYATTETVNNATSWIRTVKDKPFFLWLAFNAPHTPYHLPPAALHSYNTLSGTQANINNNPVPYFKASVEAMDTEIGRLFDSLQANNLWNNTDIIFIGDNGDENGISQSQSNAKGSIYQGGVHVPFIISGPSVVNPGRISNALVNTHDLFATILELFGHLDWKTSIPASKPVDSKSLIPIIKNQSTDIRDWVFTEVFRIPAGSADGKTMRNKDYKLLDFDNGTQKFYHITSDPDEKVDLLTGNLNSIQQENYQYLCTEMTELVGINRFCQLDGTSSVSLEAKKKEVIFPNPFKDIINIDSDIDFQSIKIYNQTGLLIYTSDRNTQIDLSFLAKGIYLFVLEGEITKIHQVTKL